MRAGDEVVQIVMGLRLGAAVEIDAAFNRRLAAAEALGLSLVDADRETVGQFMRTCWGRWDRCRRFGCRRFRFPAR